MEILYLVIFYITARTTEILLTHFFKQKDVNYKGERNEMS